jgi:uncharacterized delta-60 repeat protein
MSTITKPIIQKGQANVLTLSKSELATQLETLSSSDFSDPSNWKQVVLTYESAVGNQMKRVVFDATDENPEGIFELSEKARDEFEVKTLTIFDFDGGYLKLERDELTVLEFDIVIGSVLAIGELDLGFSSNLISDIRFNNVVNSIIVQSDGKILVGGSFTNYDNTANRNRLIRLNSDGTLDTAFCQNAVDGGKFFDGTVRTIAVQSDGKVLVGGDFSNYAGTANRNRLIRLNSDGTLDTAFCHNAVDGGKFSGGVRTIAVQSDGKVLVGGDFSNYAGTANRNRLIRLNSDGTLDTAFCQNAVDGGKFSGGVWTIAVQSDGKVLVGGNFAGYAGTANRHRLIRLNSDGTLDTAFCQNAVDGGKFSNVVTTIAVQSDGKILVGGNFESYAGTAFRNRLIRLNSDGTLDTAFTANSSDDNKFRSNIASVVIQSDGEVLVGGDFSNYAGIANRNRLIRLNSDGTLDTAFTENSSDGGKFGLVLVNSIAIQSDGKVLVGGNFLNYAGTSGRNYLIRLNSDGTLDTTFTQNVSSDIKFNNLVNSVAVQSDGKILVGGNFTDYAGPASRNRLIRLNSDGTLDTAFTENSSDGGKFRSSIESVVIQSDGKILVGGSFTSYAIQSDGGAFNRNGLVRLNSDGTLDTAFCQNAVDGAKFGISGTVSTIAVQSDGKILVGGTFTNYAGTTSRNRLIRLNSDGTLDTAFTENSSDGGKFNNIVRSIAIQSDGKILVGGNFTNYAGTTSRNRLIRLNSDGTLDTAFTENSSDGGKFSSIESVVIQSDGKILVGGVFTNYGGTSGRSRLVRLNSDGTLDTDFCQNAVDGAKFNSDITSIAIQTDGRVLVGGGFSNYAGTTSRNRLIRLNSDGTLDTAFTENSSDGGKFNNIVRSIAIQSDGKILVGGNFTNYTGIPGLSYFVVLQ